MAAKILFISGSIRQDSFNKKIIKIAHQAAQSLGADAQLVDLSEFPLPIYNGDAEAKEGLPINAKKLKEMFINSDGFLLACPEYNASVTPLLKNTIDWLSRKEPQDKVASVAFLGKVAGLISASPSGFGGNRGLRHMRDILSTLGSLVISTQVSISKAHEAFNSDGTLKDAGQKSQIESVAKELVTILNKLKA
jgi:chromate reductase